MTSTTHHHSTLHDIEAPAADVDQFLHGRRGHTVVRTVEYRLGNHVRTRTARIITNDKFRISSTTIKEHTTS